MFGLDRYRVELCEGCGLHPVILAEPDVYKFTLEERVCKVCAGQDLYDRMVAERDQQWSEKNPHAPGRAPRPSDGRHVHLVPVTPDEPASEPDEPEEG